MSHLIDAGTRGEIPVAPFPLPQSTHGRIVSSRDRIGVQDDSQGGVHRSQQPRRDIDEDLWPGTSGDPAPGYGFSRRNASQGPDSSLNRLIAGVSRLDLSDTTDSRQASQTRSGVPSGRSSLDNPSASNDNQSKRKRKGKKKGGYGGGAPGGPGKGAMS